MAKRTFKVWVILGWRDGEPLDVLLYRPARSAKAVRGTLTLSPPKKRRK